MAACVGVVLASVFLLRPGVVDSPLAWVVVAGDSMLPSLHGGDVVFVLRREEYRSGDVVAYRVPRGEPGRGIVVIHRVVGGSAAGGYVTRGDNKEGIDPWRPGPADVVGAQALHIPRVGLAIGFIRTPAGLAALAALVTFAILAGGAEAGRRGSGREPAPVRTRRLRP